MAYFSPKMFSDRHFTANYFQNIRESFQTSPDGWLVQFGIPGPGFVIGVCVLAWTTSPGLGILFMVVWVVLHLVIITEQ